MKKILVFTIALFATIANNVLAYEGYYDLWGNNNDDYVTQSTKIVIDSVVTFKPHYEQSLDFNFVSTGLFSEGCGGPEGLFAVNLNYIGGCRFSNYFFMGAGIGLYVPYDAYDVPIKQTAYGQLSGAKFSIPLFLHIKVYCSKTLCQPYFSLSLGGRLSNYKIVDYYYNYVSTDHWMNDSNGWDCEAKYQYGTSSIIINPAFGLNFRAGRKLGIYLQLGLYVDNEINLRGNRDGGVPEVNYPLDIESQFSLGLTF